MDTPLIDDDHIIELLRKDAEAGRFGSSFKAEKRDKNAPKPNTRFLRNLVRDADSHNAALLAKEKAETRARLRGLESGAKRAREDDRNRGDDSLKRQRRGEEREGRWRGVLSGLGRSNTRERDSEKRRDTHPRDSDERVRHLATDTDDASRDTKRSHRRRSRSPDSRSRSPRHRDYHDRDRKRRSHHRSRSREPKDTSRHHRSRKERSRSPDDRHGHRFTEKSSRHRRERSKETSRRARTSPSPPLDNSKHHRPSDSDSDPLDNLLGPAPPPTSRPRGRGAIANRSTMDLRFNDPTYNPRADVALSDDESEQDPWSTSLEALRDRAAWRAKGAQRLREAGFGEGDVERFEGREREKDERDLKWRGKGEGREWDAGKVVGGEQNEAREKAAWTKGIGL